MKMLLWSFLVTLFVSTVFAQSTTPSAPSENNPFPLWTGEAPGALGNAAKDIPTLTPFFPEKGTANGAAMVICPGGGYAHLAPHEGEGYAHWLAGHGITCFVLKYRLGSDGYRYPVELEDGARAIRLVRARASEWNLDPHRIGIIGSSAGGHLTSMVMTHFDAGNSNATDVIDRQSSRPDIAVLCYPVITMGKFAHQGSKHLLIGTNPPPALVEETSSELQVKKDSPPCFIWSTDEDRTVPIENTLEFAAACRKAGVAFELHVYQRGPHGQGLGTHALNGGDRQKWLPWVAECTRWLKEQGFIK
ncbi:MAG TPA: alpha/beta hydrolase [Candidatus Polarisedimenticolia bacterium]|nr:alpha/beta hydrolase [Candidatus Polarisedimenticolia bacterium]